MAVLDFLKDVVEDLVTLEVATLTNPSDKPIPLKRGLSDAEKAQLETAEAALTTAREELIKQIETSEDPADDKKRRKEIRAAKKVVKERKKSLEELKDALGIFDPKDIFSHIRGRLTSAELVAYSRFELEGDSVSYVNNKQALQGIVASHKELVTASQQARKTLFETVGKFVS